MAADRDQSDTEATDQCRLSWLSALKEGSLTRSIADHSLLDHSFPKHCITFRWVRFKCPFSCTMCDYMITWSSPIALLMIVVMWPWENSIILFIVELDHLLFVAAHTDVHQTDANYIHKWNETCTVNADLMSLRFTNMYPSFLSTYLYVRVRVELLGANSCGSITEEGCLIGYVKFGGVSSDFFLFFMKNLKGLHQPCPSSPSANSHAYVCYIL